MSLNKTEINELLKTEIVYLSTCDLKGNPHVKPIWFVYYKGDIWFETHLPTRAFKNIRENNKVVLCFGGKQTYIVWGMVEYYKEVDAPIPFRQLLGSKYKNDMDDSYITDKTRIFKVKIDKETSWHYADENWE